MLLDVFESSIVWDRNLESDAQCGNKVSIIIVSLDNHGWDLTMIDKLGVVGGIPTQT